MKRLGVGMMCVAAGVGVASLALLAHRYMTPAPDRSSVPSQVEPFRAGPPGAIATAPAELGLAMEGGHSSADLPAAAASTNRQKPLQVPAALPSPSLLALDRLRSSSQANLRLTEQQGPLADELAAQARLRVERALADLRGRQRELRDRLGQLGTEDRTGAAVAVQKELAGLLAAERRQLAELDQEFRTSLAKVLTGEQMQVVNQAVDGDGLPPSVSSRANGPGVAAPVQ